MATVTNTENWGTSWQVQWLGCGTFTAEGPGSILGQGTKILQAMQHIQKVNYKFKKIKKKIWHIYIIEYYTAIKRQKNYFPELKIKVSTGLRLFWRVKGKSVSHRWGWVQDLDMVRLSWILQTGWCDHKNPYKGKGEIGDSEEMLQAACIPWLMAPSFLFNATSVTSSNLFLSVTSAISIVKILNSVPPVNSFLPCKITYSQVPGIRV